jgi:endonuclease/exonuclease/phosphatase family metal-dependent hydrolase
MSSRMSSRTYTTELNGESVDSLVYKDDDDWYSNIVTVNSTQSKGKTLRVLTYNVHGFYDVECGKSFEEICEIIEVVDADIMVIQEFTLYGTKDLVTFRNFCKYLTSLGYVFIKTDRKHNNVVASKINCNFLEVISLGADDIRKVPRFAIAISMKISMKNGEESDLIFVGTHLDVFDETGQTRCRQVQLILDCVENYIKDLRSDPSETQVIISGDFNCIRRWDYSDDEWDHIVEVDRERGVDTWKVASKTDPKLDGTQLIEKHKFKDASVQLGTPIKSSVWANRRVDYIYGMNVNFIRAVAIRNASSDHHPVYADFAP